MKKVNSVYDLLKIVLSIMIVLIHTKILPNILYPWLRIAVPLFFVMSSYFLFSKLNMLIKWIVIHFFYVFWYNYVIAP